VGRIRTGDADVQGRIRVRDRLLKFAKLEDKVVMTAR
jgi:DNA-binding transcriptional regulator/RsmH inhibitor MraZ